MVAYPYAGCRISYTKYILGQFDWCHFYETDLKLNVYSISTYTALYFQVLQYLFLHPRSVSSFFQVVRK
jgi:hypothetical protein